MIGNTYHQLFLLGASQLACMPEEYAEVHQAAGFTKEEWDLLRCPTPWTRMQTQRVAVQLNRLYLLHIRS